MSINNIDQAVKFTVEGTRPGGSMPFMDALVTLEQNRILSINVYRKPNHMYQYLYWDSHHYIVVKDSVISTLAHRAKALCSTPELLRTEQYLREVLTKC